VFVIVDKEIGSGSSNAIGRPQKNFAISPTLEGRNHSSAGWINNINNGQIPPDRE
jgi:hypothetical protein